ncbi:MAG: hypothetical protein Q9M39_05485 [Sulfurovum sp.]|nr:hypothetical protein [Sulfurovum sp.]
MKNISIALLAFLLLAGCGSKHTPPVVKAKVKVAPVTKKKKTTYKHPAKPKKQMRLKEVEDTNYSSAYMYPEDKVKKEKVEEPIKTPLATNTAMNKEECITMISQEKFDKYTEMFGSETASIKRCNMIKAMNQS